jgi:hypothetical protein
MMKFVKDRVGMHEIHVECTAQGAIDAGLVVYLEESGTLSATHRVLSLWDSFNIKRKMQSVCVCVCSVHFNA